MKRYYFDTETSAPDSVCNDHCGNIRGARTIAQKVANELNEVVYINDCETNDIVESVFPDSILDETSESVEIKTTLTLDEISYLMALLKMRIEDDEKSISFLKYSSFYPDAKADLISCRTKSIEYNKSILKKLVSLGSEVLKNECN